MIKADGRVQISHNARQSWTRSRLVLQQIAAKRAKNGQTARQIVHEGRGPALHLGSAGTAGQRVHPRDKAVQGAHDALVQLSGTLRTLAVSLYKIANDIRLMAATRSVEPARISPMA